MKVWKLADLRITNENALVITKEASWWFVGKPYLTRLGKSSPSSDHNPESCAPGDTFQKPFSLPNSKSVHFKTAFAGHSSILTRVTRIALPLASGPNISASPSAKPDANCGNAPVMFGR